MTSTTLDAALCLLLVSAAAVTVVGVPSGTAPDPTSPDRADAVAELVSATTANVSYSLAPGAEAAGLDRTGGPEFNRVAHGTLADLLARAAFRNASVDGAPLVRTDADFRRAVRAAVARALPARTQVVARWQPYPGAHLGGRVAVGPAPPADTTVHAARVTVPLGAFPDRSRTERPAEATPEAPAAFDRTANATADRLVAGMFPASELRFALHGDAPLPGLVEHRYRRADAAYGTDASAALDDGPRAANARLRPAVAARVETDLRARFDSPDAAASSVDPDRAVVVVRTWSA
ncbi:DUF7284 family protein [Candidatus Halobonum tyrrellensis]|uniref:DUF7284 family protein n=1 Tax=Candidatus Halobonum tyrrellensis TaxID=1431545 RepID=UPI000AF72A86|nr:hypothetical protein [Candidatus Halobonum tyrrellensis]